MSQSRLEQLGLPAGYVTDEQISVIDSLSQTEFDLLVRMKRRLEDAADEVQSHNVDGGGVVW